jgi:hypothetical protein
MMGTVGSARSYLDGEVPNDLDHDEDHDDEFDSMSDEAALGEDEFATPVATV